MTFNATEILAAFGLESAKGDLVVTTPIDGTTIASVRTHKPGDVADMVASAQTAFAQWRLVPAPIRGEFVRILGQELREAKEALSRLVTLENGKILSEGRGEVQEMIDICDFAVGLSRQLYGVTMPSERPGHHMREMWHPLGPVAVITAFNFPVAVWMWNAALAFVCGDSIIWKPSEKTPLTALACQTIFDAAVQKFRDAGHDMPRGLNQILIGTRDVGQELAAHPGIPLVSATGSGVMGRSVAEIVAGRLGRSLLELGGNNAMIVTPSADLDMAVRSILFSAVGTAGQRCTTLRRLIVHEDVFDKLVPKLKKAYEGVRIGDPFNPDTLIGPLIDPAAYERMQAAIKQAVSEGGKVIAGGGPAPSAKTGQYVQPALIAMPHQSDIVCAETFAPILYVMKYRLFDAALNMHNAVPQGLSSCIFTTDMREAEIFVSSVGSDCGIANVNIGPSGAEIGGAFGGEKETGGGRESGSDSWKAYMRRQTQTVNYSTKLPLAQGVVFDI